jgi:LysM repeat protein
LARNAGAISSSPVFLTLFITFVLGFSIGFFFCYAWLGSRPGETKAPEPTPVASRPAPAPASDEGFLNELRPGEHLFLAVEGKDLSDAAGALLTSIRPFGVVLGPDNVESPEQATRLVTRIKKTQGEGADGSDLPLIAGDPDALGKVLSGEAQASFAELVAARDAGRALATGKAIAAAFQTYGIRVALGPSLAVAPDADPDAVSSVGLAYAEGLMQGGVLPVVKGYPGTDSALPTDLKELAKRFLPFTEALNRGVPGIRVEPVAVPALDVRYPERPASLSPVVVRRVLRGGGKPYRGVILADNVASEAVSARYKAGEAVVEALGAGCDAVILLETAPAKVRDACAAVARAVQEGILAREGLDESKQRLAAWREWIKSPKSLEGPLPDAQPLVAEAMQTPTAPVPAMEVTPVSPQTPEAPVAEAPAPVAAVTPTAPVEAAPAPEAPKVEEAPAAVEAPKVEETPEAEEPKAEAPKEETVAEGTQRIVYSIQQGDRLFRIAKRFGVKPEDISKWNDLSGETIKFGRKLVIHTKTPDAPPISGAGMSTDSVSVVPEPAPVPAAAEPVEKAATLPVSEPQAPGEVPATPAPVTAPAPAPVATPTAPAEAVAPEASVAPESAGTPEAPAETAGVPTPSAGVKDGLVRMEHEVLRGEMLSRIASQYGVKQSDIMKWNKLSNPNVQRGQRLMLYVKPEVAEKGGKPAEAEGASPAAPAAPEVAAPAPPAEPAVAPVAPVAPAPAPAMSVSDEGGAESYRVQAGDTASSLARKYGVTVGELLRLNGIDNPDRILVGQKIKVPRQGTAAP